MLVIMKNDATHEHVQRVIGEICNMGYRGVPMPGAQRTAICILGNQGPVENGRLMALEGVKELLPVTKPYKLVSRETQPQPTIISIGEVKLGQGCKPVIMAGPCAIEDEKQALTTAETVKKHGAQVFRGGAFKPRTSPYSFQGLGNKGLKILKKVREETGLLTITEATDHINLEDVEEYVDIIQIGARNMQNYSLLRRAGESKKPVLLKRGFAATIDELFMSAEYIMSGGNRQIILCERGIRTFSDATRNTLDISAILSIKESSHLPVVVDPSHAAGKRDFVIPLSKGVIAVGADGLLVEVHHDPLHALSDGAQSLFPEQFASLMVEINRITDYLNGGCGA